MNPQGAKWIRRERRLALYLRDGFRCVYCGVTLCDHKPDDITLDHVDPRAIFESLDHSNGNLVTACLSCNVAKGDYLVSEWLTGPALSRVLSILTQPVPQTFALAILRQAKSTKRLTRWRSAVRKAQALVSLGALALSDNSQRSGRVKRNQRTNPQQRTRND